MSRTLYLVRHAESLSASGDQKDFERTLTNNGYMNATKMGHYLFEQNVRPNKFVSSDAIRARQTTLNMAEQMKSDTNKIVWEHELYEASVRTFLKVVNDLQVEWKVVVMVGHNPTISYLAEYITGEAIEDMPTSSVVQIDFDLESWAEVSEGNGNFIRQINSDQIEQNS